MLLKHQPQPARTSLRRHTLVLGLIAAALHEPGCAQQASLPPAKPPVARSQGEIVELLLAQGRHWQTQRNPALAGTAWRKLLALQPENVEALYGLARVEIDLGRRAAAQPYVERLRRQAAGEPFIARLEQDIALAEKSQDLQRARQLAKDGKPDESVAAYRAALGDRAPTGAVGLEYYQTLGSTLDGWEDARVGLERLASQAPADDRVALALGQHLTYSDGTRRDGIVKLTVLAEQAGVVGREADQSWRKALGWLTQVPSSIPFYRTYLKRHPEDQALSSALAEIEKGVLDGAFQQIEPDPVIEHIEHGVQQLQAGKVQAAEASFAAALAGRPGEPRALGGMGLVRLRQQRYEEATQLLSQATRTARPGQGAQWAAALRNARYWTLVREAEAARNAADLPRAVGLLGQAREIDPKEPYGDILLALVQTAQGDHAQAAVAYERVLTLRPNDLVIVRNLAQALEQAGRFDAARARIDNLTPEQLTASDDLRELRARLLARDARAAMERGDDDAARVALARALQDDPQEPWNRLALARLLRQGGRDQEAAAVMAALPAPPPGTSREKVAAMLHASGLFEAERQNWPSARAALARIPAADRSASMQVLLSQASVLSDLAAARERDAAGLHEDAAALRDEAEKTADGTPELMLSVALGLGRAGDPASVSRAQALMALSDPKNDTPAAAGLRLQYAVALFTADRDDALVVTLPQIRTDLLGVQARTGLENLRIAHGMRLADRLRDAGDIAGARAALAPVMADHPDDLRLVATQARIYAAARQHREALGLYARLLAENPGDADVLIAAANAAVGMGDNDTATRFIEKAVAAAPDSAHVLVAAGRFYRGRGRTERAEQLLAAAVAADARRAAQEVRGSLLKAPTPRSMPADKPLARKVSDVVAQASLPPPRESVQAQAPVQVQVQVPIPVQLDNDSLGTPDRPPRGIPRPLTPFERKSLDQDLGEVRFDRSPVISTGLLVRSRRGEPGVSKANDVEIPIDMRWTRGETRYWLGVTPTSYDAGTASPAAALQFGSGLANSGVLPGRQRDRGVGLNAGWERNDTRIDVGTTPIGFEHVNVVGGVKLTRSLAPNWTWTADVSRRAVTDSQLSFAGMHDNRTGGDWGAVTSNGARAQLGWDQVTWGIYGAAALHALRGSGGVAHNTRKEAASGVYTHLIRTPDHQLTTGLNLSVQSYDKNLRYFTYGQGGYFSPQHLVSLSVPVEWTRRIGPVAWQLRGAVGVQKFREDSTPFFPDSASLQATAAATGGPAVYSGQRSRTLAYNAGLNFEYQATPKLVIGALLGADNSRDFKQYAGGIYIRFSRDPSNRPIPLMANPLRSPYAPQ